MKRNLLRGAFSLVLALFISIIVLCGALLGIVEQTVCSPAYLLKTAQSSGYTAQLYDQIAYHWENLLAITGVMEPETIMAVLTPEKVQEDVLSYLESAFTGSPELDTELLQEDLDKALRAYVEAYYPSAEQQTELEQNIRDLVADCISYYRSSIALPGAGRLLGTVSGVRVYFRPVALLLAGVGAVLLLFLVFLQKPRGEVFYYGAIALAADALFLLGIPALVYGYRIIQRLPLAESALKTLMDAFLEGLLRYLERMGWLAVACTVLLLLIYALCRTVGKLLEKQVSAKPEAEETI